MHGHKIYEFAITKVPQAMKECLEYSKKSVKNVKKIFLHQANEKMDDAMVNRFYKLYDLPRPENVMPMSIRKLGNSSVATIPTLYDLVKNNKITGHSLKRGDIILFGSVGAGMNVNAITYQV
jgi:3-oxoacyl-[acyl-carrier-protein] synthase-3